ncbi:MAG: histidinol-phosphatase HisJ family protein [Caldithrix sp.]|nr:histidinol-phosphatase HisJ family protein [Caldithrix sp.]
MFIDYHMHTSLCKHASGTMEAYVEAAIQRGLQEIAFTDHCPLPDDFDLAHRMHRDDLNTYVSEVQRLQKVYPEVDIKLGIEADFYDGFEHYLVDLFDQYPFDIILMSVHFIRHWPDDNWAFSYHFPGRSFKQIYSDYLQAVKRGIETGIFDVIAHLDLIKSPDEPLLNHNADEVQTIMKRANAKGMAIEINTSGLHKHIEEVFPSLNMLPLIDETGIPITLGSDAHKPDHVGYEFNYIDDVLQNYPNIQFARFNNRKMQLLNLSEVKS